MKHRPGSEHNPATSGATGERNLIVMRAPDELPPVLAGHLTPQVRARTESFYGGIAQLFERQAARRPSAHTRRGYRPRRLRFRRVPGHPLAAAGQAVTHLGS